MTGPSSPNPDLLAELAPLDALQRLTALTFDYHFYHPEPVRLVMDENMRHGPHVGSVAEARNELVLPKTQALIDRGAAQGVFRPGLEAVDLHMTISALAFYFVSNRYTFGGLFGLDMSNADVAIRRRDQVVEMVARYCRADQPTRRPSSQDRPLPLANPDRGLGVLGRRPVPFDSKGPVCPGYFRYRPNQSVHSHSSSLMVSRES